MSRLHLFPASLLRPCAARARLLMICVPVFGGTPARATGDPATLFGRVLDRVICERAPAQSYALYMPSCYVPDRKWPVIFCFDAAARGLIPVERLRMPAEKYGYIVAASLNSRNGPFADNLAAADAMVRDVTAHFSVDRERLYTAGMSGGARVATSLALAGVAKGVIACGAGFPALEHGIPRKVPFAFFGAAGVEDFNYAELQRLDAELAERHTPHRIVTFDGGHAWAPATVLTEGVEWLEVQAMRAGTRPRDPASIAALLEARLAALPATIGLERWKIQQAIVADFEGLADIGPLAREAAALAATKEVKDGLRTERRLLEREEDLIRQLGDTGSGSRRRLAEELRRKADAPADSSERRMMRRVIASYLSIARETAHGCFESQDYDQAEALLEIGVVLQPDHKGLCFDLARARAFNGSRKRALDALEQAAAAGFSDAARTDAEPAFAKLRREPRFQAILERMRAEAASPAVRLPEMRVSAVLASVELRLHYLPLSGPGTPPLSFLRVETIRPGSSAALAGMREGMEVTAIQGVGIRGLTEREFYAAMARTVKQEIVLTVREPGGLEREIRIPLRGPASTERKEKSVGR